MSTPPKQAPNLLLPHSTGPAIFQRTPLPSAPASSTVTNLQIALNNLIGQFCVRAVDSRLLNNRLDSHDVVAY